MATYLHLFNSNSEFKEYITGPDYQDPFVGITKIGGGNTYKVNYNLSEYERLLNIPLTFEITSDGDIAWIRQFDGFTTDIEYSKNGGEWTTLTAAKQLITTISITTSNGNVYYNTMVNAAYSGESGTVYSFETPLQVGSNVYGDTMSAMMNINPVDTVISVENQYNGISVVSGDTVQFRGDNATYGMYNSIILGATSNYFSGTTCGFNLKGNIMSLIDSDGFATATTLESAYTFSKLFISCTGLTDASKLVLPATTLSDYCYENMFQDCTGLITVPFDYLPATTLTSYCYRYMFEGCSSLTTIPLNYLPATTLASYCYASMFDGCTSLTTAPELPATTLASYCYFGMFAGCHGLTDLSNMILPATTLAEGCYASMFLNCTGLIAAPELPATTLADYCYAFMFEYCFNLNYIKCLATDISATNCTNCWVEDVQTNSGTFVKDANMTSWTTGIRGIPTNWTVEDAS